MFIGEEVGSDVAVEFVFLDHISILVGISDQGGTLEPMNVLVILKLSLKAYYIVLVHYLIWQFFVVAVKRKQNMLITNKVILIE